MLLLGCKPDPVDARDHLKLAPSVALPEWALVPYPSRITNQEDTNSCVGHAAAWFWRQVMEWRSIHIAARLQPLYVWYWARRMERVGGLNDAVTLRSAFRALHEFGVCPAEPYDSTGFKEIPDKWTVSYARAFRLPEYVRCQTLYDIQYSIAVDGDSVVLGVDLETPVRGRYAMAVAGYDNKAQRLRCATSWGVRYGDGGYINLPYESLGTFDAWTAGPTTYANQPHHNGLPARALRNGLHAPHRQPTRPTGYRREVPNGAHRPEAGLAPPARR